MATSPTSLCLLDYDVDIVNMHGVNEDLTCVSHLTPSLMNLPIKYKARICFNCYGRGKRLEDMRLPPPPLAALKSLMGNERTVEIQESLGDCYSSAGSEVVNLVTRATATPGVVGRLGHGVGRGSLLSHRKPDTARIKCPIEPTGTTVGQNHVTKSIRKDVEEKREVTPAESKFTCPSRTMEHDNQTLHLSSTSSLPSLLSDVSRKMAANIPSDVLLRRDVPLPSASRIDTASLPDYNSRQRDFTTSRRLGNHRPLGDLVINKLLSGGMDTSSVDSPMTGSDSDSDLVECHFMDVPSTGTDIVSDRVTADWTLSGQRVIEIGLLSHNYDHTELRTLLERVSELKDIEERTTTTGHKIVRAKLDNDQAVDWSVSLLHNQQFNKDSDETIYCKLI